MSFLVRFERKYPTDRWRFSEDYLMEMVPRLGDVVTVQSFQGTVVEVKYAVRATGWVINPENGNSLRKEHYPSGKNEIERPLYLVLLG